MALRLLKTVQTALGRAEELLAIALVVILLVVVNLQIFARYLFNHPFIWPEEVSRLVLVWITFIGTAALTRRGADLAVDTFIEMMPPGARRVTLIVRDLVLIAVFSLVAVQGYEFAKAVNSMPLVATGWPTAMLAWPVIIGAGLTVFHCVLRLIEHFANPTEELPHTPRALT